MEFGQKKILEIDLFDFTSFFDLDFFKFSGPHSNYCSILICFLDTHRKRSGGSTSDDQYFRDNRTWTSTRDRHLEMTGLQSDEELNANEIFVQTESKNQIPVSNLLSD